MIADPLDHVMELALIRAIPCVTRGKVQGRLKSLYNRLQKHVDKEFRKVPQLSTVDIEKVRERIHRFGTTTGWEGKEMDVPILLSFVLGLIEESRHVYPKTIIRELNHLFDFMTRDDPDNAAFKEAEKALAVWQGR